MRVEIRNDPASERSSARGNTCAVDDDRLPEIPHSHTPEDAICVRIALSGSAQDHP